MNIKDGNGNNASGSLSDLGVSYNVDKTVTELLAAKHQTNGALEYINEVNPFVKKNVPLNAKSNKLALRTFVTDKFVQDTDRAVPSTASYDANARAFVAVEGRGGRSPKVDNVIDAVAKAIANPGHSGSVTITYETIDVPVALPEAQNVADQANARLNAPIVLDNGQGKTFQIPAEVVASWLKTDADLEHGTLSLSYDDNAITNYVQQQVPAQLNQDAVDQEDAVDNSGKVLATIVKGVNGVKVKNMEALAPKIGEALKNGQGATIPVDGDVQNFKTVQKKSEYRIVVDRTAQTATVYHNDEAVKTFPGVHGHHRQARNRPGHLLHLPQVSDPGHDRPERRRLALPVQGCEVGKLLLRRRRLPHGKLEQLRHRPRRPGALRLPRLREHVRSRFQVDLRQLPGRRPSCR